MSIKTQIISIISTIVLGIFIWFGYSLYWSLTIPDTDSYVVLDKVEKQVIQSTGKYSSELVYRTFIEVRYENGDQTTIHVDDPIQAKKYVIGNKYTTNKYHEHMPFSVVLGYCWFTCLTIFIIFALITLYGTYLIYGKEYKNV